MHKRLLILGSQGVPAQQTGFDVIAEELSVYLVKKGWRVTVYCQEDWNRTVPYETMWGRVRRVHIPVKQQGLLGSMVFGFKSALHARKHPTMALTLGSQNAVFSLLQRLRGKTNLFHLGDLQQLNPHLRGWHRLWLKLNSAIARRFANHLIVDNPELKTYFSAVATDYTITMIPNGAHAIIDASASPIRELDLEPGKYSTFIAHPTADHSLLEIVQAFSLQPRAHTLVVLGDMDPQNPYHQQVLEAASSEVKFVGALYQKETVQALRYHSYLYFHGHQLGGTGPGLVEALAAGNPIVAFDSPSTRWVTGPNAALFFTDSASCAAHLDHLLATPDSAIAMKKAARLRHAELFTWDTLLPAYETLLTSLNPYEPEPEGWEQHLKD